MLETCTQDGGNNFFNNVVATYLYAVVPVKIVKFPLTWGLWIHILVQNVSDAENCIITACICVGVYTHRHMCGYTHIHIHPWEADDRQRLEP